MNRAGKARKTLKLLNDGHYNFDRPSNHIEKEFGEVLVMLQKELTGLRDQVKVLSEEIDNIVERR